MVHAYNYTIVPGTFALQYSIVAFHLGRNSSNVVHSVDVPLQYSLLHFISAAISVASSTLLPYHCGLYNRDSLSSSLFLFMLGRPFMDSKWLHPYRLHRRVDVIVLCPCWWGLCSCRWWLDSVYQVTDVAPCVKYQMRSLATLHRNDRPIYKGDIVAEGSHSRVCPTDTIA